MASRNPNALPDAHRWIRLLFKDQKVLLSYRQLCRMLLDGDLDFSPSTLNQALQAEVRAGYLAQDRPRGSYRLMDTRGLQLLPDEPAAGPSGPGSFLDALARIEGKLDQVLALRGLR